MIETRNVMGRILERIEEVKIDLNEELELLEDKKIEEKYLKEEANNSITDLYSLLDFYNGKKSNIDKISFDNFVYYVMQDDNKKEEFLNELHNISLLTKTGLLKFSKEDNYSKQIIGNFLLKIGKIQDDVKEGKTAEKEIKKIRKNINLLDKYKTHISPIGIVKEVDDAKNFNNFLELLNLDDNDKMISLINVFEFNTTHHINKLNKYELDLQRNKDIINNKYKIDKDNLNSINELLKEESITKYIPKKKVIKRLEENKEDDIITKAKNYLDKNNKLLNGLSEVQIEDIEGAMDVYLEDEELREEVYRTTEDIDRLLTYEIKTILDNDKDITIKNEKLKPVISYIEKINNNIKNKK